MAIDFSKVICVEKTNEKIFGICDDSPPNRDPAYLDYNNSDNWIAWIDNSNSKEIIFTAIDNCIFYYRENGEQESSCDGYIKYSSTIAFIELKDRNSGGWLGVAIDQLKTTIKVYKNEVDISLFNEFYAFVCNKQRPYFHSANFFLIEKFKDETDFILKVDYLIKIN